MGATGRSSITDLRMAAGRGAVAARYAIRGEEPERDCGREVDVTGTTAMSLLSLSPRDRLSCAVRSFAVAEERVDAPSETERRRVGEVDAWRAATERETRSLTGESSVL